MKKIVTLKYSLGSLAVARNRGLETDYLFFLQLKTLITSSVIKVGRGYLKKLSEDLNLSETTISTRVNSLVKKGFATKVYDRSEKIISINLTSYYKVYRNVFFLDEGLLTQRIIKYKTEWFQKRSKLKEFIDLCEVAKVQQRVINKNIKINGGLPKLKLTKEDLKSTKMVPSKSDNFEDEVRKNPIYSEVSVSHIALAKTLGKVSISYVHKLINKLSLLRVFTKSNNKEVIYPKTSGEAFLMKFGGFESSFYSKRKGLYFQQKMNSYFFTFDAVFSKHREFHKNIFKTLKLTLLNHFNAFESSKNLLLD